MFSTWREQYRANQEVKREIQREEWEQEKRWREEDRAARQKVLEANAVDLEEHNVNLKTASAVSYLTLICHDDTWTFVATEAFGIWHPTWTTSTSGSHYGCPAPMQAGKFNPNPNLTKGRISRLDPPGSGLLRISLSGHNLVRILDKLRDGTAADDVVHSARCIRLYGKFAEFVALVDPGAPAGMTTGVEFRIDDSVDTAPGR
ncbi:hypothetical protein [Streptomyces harbinensis]|uniref:hypothetical protein n=1 Tax=Streptomyces harbinensis TaxID=1176198 RepID=UPI0034DF6794